MSRIPSHLRSIKIKELRELQKHGMSREKQIVTEVLGTRLLASANRPTLKRYMLLVPWLIVGNLLRMRCLIWMDMINAYSLNLRIRVGHR